MLGAIFDVYSTLQGPRGARALPGLSDRLADGLDAMLRSICRLERTADLTPLLEQLTQRNEAIVMAFSHGQIESFGQPMSDEIRSELAAAQNERWRCRAPLTRLIGASSAKIVAAAVTGQAASLSIAFTAQIESLLQSCDETDVPSHPRGSIDVWTFERSTDRRRSEWMLIATEPVD